MTGRDRLVLVGIVLLAVLAGGWMLVVSPERKRAGEALTEVSAAQQKLEAARSQLANARSARAQYASAYTALVRLGKAVPPEQQVPSLVYEINQASNGRNVDFTSIAATQSNTGPAGGKTAAASAAVFTPMPFTFVFKGTYYQLFHLFHQIQAFAQRAPSGEIQVSGRLLTIQNMTLTREGNGGEANSGKGTSGQLIGTITATAYVLPISPGLTAGATPGGPSATPASGSTPSSSTTAGSGGAPAAVVTKVGP